MLSVILQRMTGLSLALVLLSGLTHASWNLLLKNSHNQEVFIWWLKTTITILLVPVAVILMRLQLLQKLFDKGVIRPNLPLVSSRKKYFDGPAVS